jgi:hypothetical protein
MGRAVRRGGNAYWAALVMAFNSDTYHANKQRRMAWRDLDQARQFRAEGQTERAGIWVKSARLAMRLSVMYRRFAKEKHR